jgi:hypothetical protein
MFSEIAKDGNMADNATPWYQKPADLSKCEKRIGNILEHFNGEYAVETP